jgi:hypothetical protein
MSQIQFPGTANADFLVDQVTDPNGDPAEVLDLDMGFAVSGHIDFPSWMSGTGNVSIYADQVGGGYDEKILSTDITITATGPEPALTLYNWTATYPADLPTTSTGLTDPSPAPGSQVYRLTAVFTYNGAVGDVGAFVDMGPYMIN